MGTWERCPRVETLNEEKEEAGEVEGITEEQRERGRKWVTTAESSGRHRASCVVLGHVIFNPDGRAEA